MDNVILSWYKIKVCQKDTAENHLKTLALAKNLN